MDRNIIDEDLKKKIESTKFVFMVAKSATGKTFSGDYLESIRGWKHIDGDTILKQSPYNHEYKDALDQIRCAGDYADNDKDEEWKQHESWKAHQKILARLTLEGARDSKHNTGVVVTHATSTVSQRTFLTQQLKDAGAKDVSMVFLHCDCNVRMEASWNRVNRMAAQAGMSVREFFGYWGTCVTDFDSFVELYKEEDRFDGPDESEQPYKVVDVTAKDVTVFDGLDEAFGIDKTKSRGSWDLSYEERVLIIRAIDEKRDQTWMDSGCFSSEDSVSAELDMVEKEPEKFDIVNTLIRLLFFVLILRIIDVWGARIKLKEHFI